MPRENRPTRRGGIRGDLSEVRKKGISPSSSDSNKSSLWNSVKNWATSRFAPSNKPISQHSKAVGHTRKYNQQQREHQARQAEKVYEKSTQNSILNKLRKTASDYVNKSFSFSNQPKTGDIQQVTQSRVFTRPNKPTTVVELAQNAATRDTAQNFYDRQLGYLKDYTIDQDRHNDIIKWGEDILEDDTAITEWLAEARYNPKEFDRRLDTIKRYFSVSTLEGSALQNVPTWDPDTNTYQQQAQMKTDAEFPPWLRGKATKEDLDNWEYYTTYSHDVVQRVADSYEKVKREADEMAKYGYKSAWGDDPDAVNSFSKVLIHAWGTDDTLKDTFTQYMKEYYINPHKHGKLKTIAGNAFYNMMDTMDIAARGARAAVASDYYLGGKQHNFKGQDAFWIQLDGQTEFNSERAQRLFFDAGGDELLSSKKEGGSWTSYDLGDDYRNDIKAKLEKEFRAQGFEAIGITWESVYDALQNQYYSDEAKDKLNDDRFARIKANLKKAYTDPSAEFSADTGDTLGDILTETVLDPGLLIGGVSKAITKGTAKTVGKRSVTKGIRNLVSSSDEAAEVLGNPKVVRAVNDLINSNEGRNILFKKYDDFASDVDRFVRNVKAADPKLLTTKSDEMVLRNTLVNDLMGANMDINGNIISSTSWHRKALDNKAFKTMAYADLAIDKIDSAIIKTSFIEPYLLVKGTKGIKRVGSKSRLVGRLTELKNLKNQEAIRTLVGAKTGDVDVTRVEDLIRKADEGVIDEHAAKKAFKAVTDQYDELTARIDAITRDFNNGKISDEDAIRKVSDEIQGITDGGKKTVNELEAYVNSIKEVRYVDGVQKSFDDVKKSFDNLTTSVNRKSSSRVNEFIDEVRQVKTEADLRRLFRENIDNNYILGQRTRVIDNLPEDLRKIVDTDYLNNLVEEVRAGVNADITYTNDEFIKETSSQIDRIGKASSATVERNLTFDTFKELLDNLEFKFNGRSEFDKKISKFIKEWKKTDYVIYSTGDALKVLDRMQRQINTRLLLSSDITSEGAALVTHQVTTEFRKLRKQIKNIDVVSLKDAKVVTTLHTDRMALQQLFRNDPRIRKMYEDLYADLFDEFLQEIDKIDVSDADLMESSFVQSMLSIRNQIRGFTATENMINQARNIQGLSDNQLNTFLNILGSDLFSKNLDELVLNPQNLNNKLRATLKAQTGESKLGMRNLTDSLKSIDSEAPAKFLEPYLDELKDPRVKARYNAIVNKDPVDPTAYVEKQMLATALMDSSVISTWNEMAKAGKNPMGFHINTTGLNSDFNSITSVSFKKWVPLEFADGEEFTLNRLLDHLDEQETVVFRRDMSSDIGEISEDVLRSFDMKDMTSVGLRNHYKSFYGPVKSFEKGVFKSEQELLEAVCGYVSETGQYLDEEGVLRMSVPSLMVHDLDGFNIPFLNKKVLKYQEVVDENSQIYGYLRNSFKGAEENSFNTYDRLAKKVGDEAYTEDQIRSITEVLTDYVDKLNKQAPNYRFLDYKTVSNELDSMVKTLSAKAKSKEGLTDIEERFLKKYASVNGAAVLNDYKSALSDVSKLTINPRQWAFTSSGLGDNPIKAALQESGRTVVNVDSRIYVDDVLSFFDIADDGVMEVSIEDLQKMHEMSEYIIRKRNKDISSSAYQFLAPRKDAFDYIISSFIDMARINSWDGTQLAYLENLKIPDNPVDSYLMADKLYKDFFKYWTDPDEVFNLAYEGQQLDILKNYIEKTKSYNVSHPSDKIDISLMEDQLFHQAVDFLNNNRKRFFYERIAGGLNAEQLRAGDAFEILEGAHQSEIFKSAARSDYHKTVFSYENGSLKYGIDKATDWSEACSDVTRNLNDLRNLDTYFTTRGIDKRSDRMLASLHMKTKQLFDILRDTKIDERSSFQKFISKASETHRLKLHNARLLALKSGDEFSRERLLSEMLHNGFNMVAFNAHNYDVVDMNNLRDFVAKLQKDGDDFLSYYEDRTTGNIFVYINDQAQIGEEGNKRFIRFKDKHEGFERFQKDSIALPDFDELKGLDDLSDLADIEDFRAVYSHLQSCWSDTVMLSNGSINGTTGKALSRTQAEEFLASLPTAMNDWCTSEGLLRSEINRSVVYDPGFAINEESDLLLDYLGTMEHQAAVAKDDAILINEMFLSDDVLKFSDLADNFDEKDLIKYFGENPEYVVCSFSGSDTRTGFQVRQIKMDNSAAIKFAKESPYTTILPYDVFCEVADQMNRTSSDDLGKRLLGKYLVAYKAFALVKPSTVLNNYRDATLKAALDTGEGTFGGLARMLFYEQKAIKGMDTYHRIMKSDPSLLTKSNWDIIQRSFKTDLTFEEFEILRGVMDGNSRFATADKHFINNTAKSTNNQRIISGKDIGLRNLDETDIRTAFNKYLAKESDLPLTEKQFIDIYLGDLQPDEIMNEQYEGMFRKLSNNLRHTDASNIFDKSINNMFKPFGAVENIVRYAQTLSLVDQGYSGNQVLRHIHDTQFYSAPTWGTWNTLEKVMPFCTFKYNNIMYWIRMMDENPRYFRYFEEIYGNIMDDTFENMAAQGQEISYENDYGVSSGSIPIGQGKYYLKISNSFMSGMNDFYGLPTDIQSINPLFRDTLRLSLYGLGLNSSRLFSDVDLDITDDDPVQKVVDLIPGGRLMQQGYKTFHNIAKVSTEEGGPNMESLVSIGRFLGFIGQRNFFTRDGSFSFEDYQDDLAAQGKWYDCNLGKVVDISQKNEYGANNPENSFEDTRAYMLMNHGKLWDANQHKFVTFEEYIPGGYNDGFDWDADPEKAWEDLQNYQALWGKVYDYNQRKFVYREDFISGGLNSPMEFDKRVQLMQEKFPNLKWDANQNTFVDEKHYIAGGLNDLQGLEGREFLSHWNELKSLRRALYGETYVNGEFVQTEEPMIVLSQYYTDRDTLDKYDNYFSLLAIPRLQTDYSGYTLENGLIKNKDGKYVLTGDPEYDSKVFATLKNIYAYTSSGRRYNRWKRYSYNKTRLPKKPYKGNPANYQTGYGWNEEQGYYRLEYSYTYQYHSPQPASRTLRLIDPPIHYPYGGQYGKFSFQSRV